MQVLEKEFKSLFYRYADKKETIFSYWKELILNYNSKNRHYHNLTHLSELLQFYNEFEHNISKKDVVLFSIFYHDIIYDVKKSNNEEKSAELAKQRLQAINIQSEKVKLVYDYIIDTKLHKIENDDADLAYFLDFDMAILGKDWNNYLNYTAQIRKEYSIYPKILYNNGRKKALKHFLEDGRIYKTEAFFKRFEEQAKKNIQKELNLL